MTVRQHLAVVHRYESEKCSKLAKEHGGLAECYGGMLKAASKEESATYSKLAQHHSNMAKILGDASDKHSGFAGDCEKAKEDALGKTLVPDRFSSIPFEDYDGFGFAASHAVRAVARPGAPDPVAMNKAMAGVAPEF